MKGNSKPLLKYMEGSDTRFIIPVYQRNYDWKKENCKQLLDDLVKVVVEGRPSHFFGSIVSSTEGSDNIIIDGQQRLTTVSILLLALTNLVREGKVACDAPYLADKITNDYLVDQWQPEEKKIKLKPVKNDQKAFNRLFGDEEDYVLDSKVTQNYLFFREQIVASGIKADELFQAIRKLVVIDIALEDGDNAQLIFESLNSTGLDLSEADKVRNYVLMGLPRKTQESYYEKYWNPIEEYTDYEVSEFIRQYLTFRTAKWPNIGKVYPAFKDYAEKQESMEGLLADMLKYARVYHALATAGTPDPEANRILRRMVQLETNVVNPLLFSLLGRAQDGSITYDGLCVALRALESYIYRRLVCEVPTNSMNKTFANLGNEADRLCGPGGDFVGAMVYALCNKPGTTRFPDDAEFEERTRLRDFYNMRQKNRIYTFDRLENGDSYEKVDVRSLMLDREHPLSVEHVMPQTLTEAWKRELGSDWDRIHVEWRDRIANLTLTGYNSKYKNRPFAEKRTIKDGFKDSPLYLNKWIGQQKVWTENQLKAREDMLAVRFLELWPFPEVTFVPKEKDDAVHTLDDDFNFTGTKVAAYALMGTRKAVKTWKDAVVEVLSQVYELDPSTMRLLAATSDYPGNYLRLGGVEGNGWHEIGKGCFAYMATSTSAKMGLLEVVFERAGLSGDDLAFEIRLDDDGDES